jgi:hypothetical protein
MNQAWSLAKSSPVSVTCRNRAAPPSVFTAPLRSSNAGHSGDAINRDRTLAVDVRFSNRPFGVKHFQTIHRCGVDVAHGLVLLFGIGTKALPSWDPRTRWNDLWVGLAVK